MHDAYVAGISLAAESAAELKNTHDDFIAPNVPVLVDLTSKKTPLSPFSQSFRAYGCIESVQFAYFRRSI